MAYEGMTRGGNGSHWDGCEAVHWDCALTAERATREQAERTVAEQQAEIERLRAEMCAKERDYNDALNLAVGAGQKVDRLADALRSLLDCIERYMKWTHNSISAGPPMDQEPRRDSHMLYQIRECAASARAALAEHGREAGS